MLLKKIIEECGGLLVLCILQCISVGIVSAKLIDVLAYKSI